MAHNNSPLTSKELQALRFIRNRIARGEGAPSVREIQIELGYLSPRSGAQVIHRLIEAGFLSRERGARELRLERMPSVMDAEASTIEVPLVGGCPCGAPLLAVENVEMLIPVSVHLARPPHQYFLLRADGDSMDEAGIPDGDLVLVRRQQHAEDGDRVVALVDDEATIKELRRSADAVALVPRSTNKKHKPIVLTRDFLIQGVVVASIPNVSF